MARFDVYVSPTDAGWLLDVQSDIIPDIGSRIVVPLVALPIKLKPVRILNPVFVIEGVAFVMLTHLVFAIPAALLGRSRFSLGDHYDEIKRALDMAFDGF